MIPRAGEELADRIYTINWGSTIVPLQHFDALLYMHNAEKMRPLAWRPCGL